MTENKFIKGSLKAIILKMLDEHGRMYGYEMTKVARELSKGSMLISEAALYPALHKLEAEGLLTTEHENVEGRVRKYYSLSKKGKTESPIQTKALQDAIEALKLFLTPNLSNG